MATIRTLIVAALACFLSLIASALEPSAAIKVTPLLKTSTSWNGAPLEYPKGQAEITGLLLELAPGGETGWHQHPVPSFGMVMEGTLTVTLKDGRVQTIHAGEPVAEVENTLHNGRNLGATPVKLLVFYAGAVGQPVTIREPGGK